MEALKNPRYRSIALVGLGALGVLAFLKLPGLFSPRELVDKVARAAPEAIHQAGVAGGKAKDVLDDADAGTADEKLLLYARTRTVGDVARIIQSGANVDFQDPVSGDEQGYTALMYASANSKMDVVSWRFQLR